ncbi:MAG: hypothetical protein ACOYNO_06440 [Saprospiraceae bacterium]
MSFRTIGLVAGCFLIYFGCQTPEPAPPAFEPEDVLRLWQGYIDQNQFDSAQLYSTEATRPFLDFLKSITFVEDSTIISLTLLRDLECRVFGDSALCTFATKDEIGRDVPDTLLLRRLHNRWLVDWRENPNDIPLDSMLEGNDDGLLFPEDSLDPELE